MSSNKTTTQTQQPKAETANRKPIHEIRLSKVKAAVWENTTDNGVFYNVTVSRLYRDGDHWESSDSFGRDEGPSDARGLDYLRLNFVNSGCNLTSWFSSMLSAICRGPCSAWQ